MSNEVYPTLPGLTYGQVRTIIAPPVEVRTTPAQREYRARDALLPRYAYTLPYAFLRSSASRAELQALVGFYARHGGRFESFLFNDRDDNTATDAPFGVGDGVTTVFQALRPYGGFSEGIDAFNSVPAVKANGSLASGVSITAGQGRITFATAPAAGVVLTWSGTFYRRVRFDGAQLEATKFLHQLWEAKRVQLISVKA